MKERWIEVSSDADEKQEEKFQTWSSGQGISFADSDAENNYKERVGLIKDAIQMKKAPQRVPVCPSPGFFPIQYGGITPYEAHYDHEKLVNAWKKYCNDFNPDSFSAPSGIIPGRVLDLLDYKLYHWPGHGIPKDKTFQFVEKEYMKAEEYQDFIDDPTGFFINVYFPRTFGALTPLELIPLLPPIHELPLVNVGVIPFGIPDIQEAIKKLIEAGDIAVEWATHLRHFNLEIMGRGYPSFTGGFSKAPFDAIGDSLRGTVGIMMDMFRYPDELLEACERMTPFMVKMGIAASKATGHPIVFMPLHKGADGFMSEEQFNRFYWPTLRKVIIGLINEGIVPILFAEGSYNTRLDLITDLPEGKTIWLFDRSDMARAKKTIGRIACIAGNVPLSLLCTGTPDEVKIYCKNLIDTAKGDGGFILATGAGMDGTKPENVEAMIEFSKQYGAY